MSYLIKNWSYLFNPFAAMLEKSRPKLDQLRLLKSTLVQVMQKTFNLTALVDNIPSNQIAKIGIFSLENSATIGFGTWVFKNSSVTSLKERASFFTFDLSTYILIVSEYFCKVYYFYEDYYINLSIYFTLS